MTFDLDILQAGSFIVQTRDLLHHSISLGTLQFDRGVAFH